MVESLKELNKRCQKPNYKKTGNWMVRTLLRDAALPLTWVLLHTPMTANQVTLAALIIGLLGAVYIALPGPGVFLVGMLLIQFWYYLDHVDGQIARYRGTACLSGRFFDFLMHHLIHGIVYFALGFYMFLKHENAFYVLLGFMASVAVFSFNMIHDIKYKTFFEKLLKERTPWRPETAEGERPRPEAGASLIKRLYSGFHKACEMHVVMNVLTGAALLEYFFKTPLDLRANLFMVYAAAAVFLAVTKITYLIINRKIDHEYERYFNTEKKEPSAQS